VIGKKICFFFLGSSACYTVTDIGKTYTDEEAVIEIRSSFSFYMKRNKKNEKCSIQRWKDDQKEVFCL
jgi:hypothetical protein